MKINEFTVEKRLKRVAEEHRVFIYNAEIVIEFLNYTFMPTRFFLKPDAELGPAIDLEEKHLTDPDALGDQLLDVNTLYEYYRLFREAKSYTAEIETLFKFKVILGKMRLLKNGWEFFRIRKGRAQIVSYAPLVLRAKVPVEIRDQYPIIKTNVAEGQVPTDLEDFQEEDIEELDKKIDEILTAEPPQTPGLGEHLPFGGPIPIRNILEHEPGEVIPAAEPNVWDEINGGDEPPIANPELTDY